MLAFLHVYLHLDLRSNFVIVLIISKLTYFGAFLREKHDGVKSFTLSLIDSKLFRKKCFDENDPFYIWPINQKWDIRWTLMMSIERPLQELSIHIFSFFLAITVDEMISNVYMNIGIGKFMTVDLIWPWRYWPKIMKIAAKWVYHGSYLPTKFCYSGFYRSQNLRGGANRPQADGFSVKKPNGNRVNAQYKTDFSCLSKQNVENFQKRNIRIVHMSTVVSNSVLNFKSIRLFYLSETYQFMASVFQKRVCDL